MKVYILGPMRGIRHYNFPAFDAARDRLKGWGYTPVSPADIDRADGFDPFDLPDGWDWMQLPDGMSQGELVDRDLAALRECDAFHALPGWEHSRGATAERAVAKWRGLDEVRNPDAVPAAMETVCEEAARITSGDRDGDYGHPADHWARTIGAINAMFDTSFRPRDWGTMMMLDKLARLQHRPKRDNLVDAAGYARCTERVLAVEGVEGFAA